MKKFFFLLAIGFLVVFTGTSEANGHYWRWRHSYPPLRRVVVVHPCVCRMWVPPHWEWRFGRRVWFSGFWIIR